MIKHPKAFVQSSIQMLKWLDHAVANPEEPGDEHVFEDCVNDLLPLLTETTHENLATDIGVSQRRIVRFWKFLIYFDQLFEVAQSLGNIQALPPDELRIFRESIKLATQELQSLQQQLNDT